MQISAPACCGCSSYFFLSCRKMMFFCLMKMPCHHTPNFNVNTNITIQNRISKIASTMLFFYVSLIVIIRSISFFHCLVILFYIAVHHLPKLSDCAVNPAHFIKDTVFHSIFSYQDTANIFRQESGLHHEIFQLLPADPIYPTYM